MSVGSGVLPVLKPPGPTSLQVVQQVRRAFGPRARVGHAGTLDPEAAGVLPVCVGPATRLADYLQRPPKTYRFELILGAATDTQDATGQVLARSPVDGLSAERLTAVLDAFRGRITQTAPLYSARHHAGRRLYDIAREGGEAPRPEFPVQIWDLRLLRWSNPAVALCEVRCGGGTYVRALCDDIGRRLGCGGHMGALIRCAAGGFLAAACRTLEEIAAAAREGDLEALLVPPATALSFLPALTLDDREAVGVVHGRAPGRRRQPGPDGDRTVRLLDGLGMLLAVAAQRTRDDIAEFVLEKVLPPA